MAAHELRLEPQIAEIPKLIDWVEACCAAEGLTAQASFRMALALEEAVTNVIGHAFAGIEPPHLVRVRLEITAKKFVAEVIDNGHPFDPTTVPEPDLSLPLEQRPSGGLGIHLMRSMMDSVRYRRSGGENLLRLEKARR